MKRIPPVLILTGWLFGQDIIQIKTGTFFGLCFGYCLSKLTISSSDADYTLYGWDENDPVYLPVAISDTVDSIIWEDLNTQFSFELFMSLDSVIGWIDKPLAN